MILNSDDSLITKGSSCSTVSVRVKDNFKIKELGNIEKEKYKRFYELVQLEQMTLGPWDPTKDKTKEFGFIDPLYREYFGSDPSNMPSEQRRAVSLEALKLIVQGPGSLLELRREDSTLGRPQLFGALWSKTPLRWRPQAEDGTSSKGLQLCMEKLGGIRCQWTMLIRASLWKMATPRHYWLAKTHVFRTFNVLGIFAS